MTEGTAVGPWEKMSWNWNRAQAGTLEKASHSERGIRRALLWGSVTSKELSAWGSEREKSLRKSQVWLCHGWSMKSQFPHLVGILKLRNWYKLWPGLVKLLWQKHLKHCCVVKKKNKKTPNPTSSNQVIRVEFHRKNNYNRRWFTIKHYTGGDDLLWESW